MIRQHNLLLATSLTPHWHCHNDVNAAVKDDCNVFRYALTKPQVPSGHTRTEPVINYQKCPKHSNSSTKRSFNQRPSSKTNKAPGNTPNICLPTNPSNLFPQQNKDKPPHVPLLALPDALTSSTRTNFTNPPIDDLARMLLN
jgi:hypothetical protein